VQLGLNVEAIIGCAYPSFGFGGRNSVGHWFLTSTFNYKFSFGSGRTVGQFPNCTKPRPLAAINLDTSQIFGEKSKFAIYFRACPDKYNYAQTDKMAICHLIISNNLIGQPDEECYLPTWIFSLTNRCNRIVDTKHLLFPKEFNGLSDREIFEIILKANQLEDEFHSDFLYLPQLDNKFWSDHLFALDETIDGYLIYFYVKDNQITFLIEDETERIESDYRSYKFIFHSVSLDLFVDTVNQATEFLLQQYPYLKDNVSSRSFNSR
jgi:hypothetical protein